MARFVGGEAEIQRAADRMRGQVVHTPLIGDIRLPLGSGQVQPGPRLKAECLQTGGSVEYRGALHYLLRRLGGLKGVVAAGPARRLLACARAAESLRLPMLALCHPPPLPRHCRELIAACGVRVEELKGKELKEEELDAPARLAAAARETGYHVMPWVEAGDHALGVATLGLELGRELPGDLLKVYVSPAGLAPAIARGLLASGHRAAVVPVDGGGGLAELQQALLFGVNLRSDALGAAALGQALRDGDVDRSCVILSC